MCSIIYCCSPFSPRSFYRGPGEGGGDANPIFPLFPLCLPRLIALALCERERSPISFWLLPPSASEAREGIFSLLQPPPKQSFRGYERRKGENAPPLSLSPDSYGDKRRPLFQTKISPPSLRSGSPFDKLLERRMGWMGHLVQ